MKQYPSGTYLIKAFVTLGDFVLLNFIIIGFILFAPNVVPDYIHHAPRTCMLVANISMAVSQYFYHTVIHFRQTNFEMIVSRVFRLAFTHVLIMFILLRFLSNGGGLFRFMIIYATMLLCFLMAARVIERHIVAMMRAKVGPRPHMLHHTEIYRNLIDKYMVRHFYKPGITGWAQVTGFRGETKELWQMEARIKRDIWYIENWTFWLDIKIILMTVTSSLHPNQNAY